MQAHEDEALEGVKAASAGHNIGGRIVRFGVS
jgi:hypothetical protein